MSNEIYKRYCSYCNKYYEGLGKFFCSNKCDGKRRIKSWKVKFWEKVDKNLNPPCWEWVAGKNRKGYGTFATKNKIYRAHRFSWTIHYGKIPKGLFVLHHCDNPSCVRPSHLWVGTQLENMKDMYAKGRGKNQNGKNWFS